MARLEHRLPQNVPGEFFVDRSCIDCDTCRQVAPAVFAQSEDEQSYVFRQPGGEPERLRALMALVACPTASIGTTGKANAREAARAFPEEIAAGVYYCGYAAEDSFGASSYLVVRPGGNVLVDSPRAAAPLLARLAELGGVRWMFLTHRDDVADHARFREAFGCERILHRDDAGAGTRDVERPIEGRAPVRLDDDLTLIPVPGHTRGSLCLLYRETFLFTGDHLWWSEARRRLHASRSVSWYSWSEQVRSVEQLLDFRFEWILPGHGRRYHAPSTEAMRTEIERLVAELRRQR